MDMSRSVCPAFGHHTYATATLTGPSAPSQDSAHTCTYVSAFQAASEGHSPGELLLPLTQQSWALAVCVCRVSACQGSPTALASPGGCQPSLSPQQTRVDSHPPAMSRFHPKVTQAGVQWGLHSRASSWVFEL